MAPFYGWNSTTSEQETVYFLPLQGVSQTLFDDVTSHFPNPLEFPS